MDVQIPRDSPYHAPLQDLDIFFTVIFTLEFLINFLSNWFKPFISNGWNYFDFIVIFLSLVALGLANMPVTVLRLVRAFRVVRLFGRMQTLKNILTALSSSILPEINAFMIMFIVIAICKLSFPLPHSRTEGNVDLTEHFLLFANADAIAGVTFFGDQAPDQFGAFTIAFLTLFRIAVGETWFDDSLPATRADGSTNYGAIFFFISYVLVVNWTLLQACVAVLVDNFITSSAQSQIDDLARVKEERRNRMIMKSSLDPLLGRIIKDYTDERDLSSRLLNLFKVLCFSSFSCVRTRGALQLKHKHSVFAHHAIAY